MAYSGVRTITKTAQQIIRKALMKIVQSDPTPSFSADMTDDSIDDLNGILATLQAEGVGIWQTKTMTVYLQKDTASYLVGPAGANCTLDTPVETTIATAALLGDTTLTLTTNTGMNDADYIGIQLDDGTLQWTTITTVLPANQVLIAAALTDTSAVGKVVYTYTTKTDRPVEVLKGLSRTIDGTDQELFELSRDEYVTTPQKTNTGSVTQWYYDPQLTNGTLYVWEAPDDVTDRLKFLIRQPFQFIESPVDDIEMPAEWLRVIEWLLAAEIAPEYGINLTAMAYIEGKAEKLKDKMAAFDMDKGSFYFQPDLSR